MSKKARSPPATPRVLQRKHLKTCNLAKLPCLFHPSRNDARLALAYIFHQQALVRHALQKSLYQRHAPRAAAPEQLGVERLLARRVGRANATVGERRNGSTEELEQQHAQTPRVYLVPRYSTRFDFRCYAVPGAPGRHPGRALFSNGQSKVCEVHTPLFAQ